MTPTAIKTAIAASFTLANGLCGFAAIILLAMRPADPPYLIAAILIFAAWSFDMVDGIVARQLGVAGAFGAILDSLCDVVTFGVVPALAVTMVASSVLPSATWLTYLVAGAYLTAALVRLARFTANVTGKVDKPKPGRYRLFDGLSTPGAAMAIAAFLVAWPPGAIAVALVCAGLMVSKLPYPDLGHIYLTRALPAWHLLIPVALVVVLSPATLLAAGFIVYLVLGPILGAALKRRMAH